MYHQKRDKNVIKISLVHDKNLTKMANLSAITQKLKKLVNKAIEKKLKGYLQMKQDVARQYVELDRLKKEVKKMSSCLIPHTNAVVENLYDD